MATHALTDVEQTDNDAENTKKSNTDQCRYTFQERRSKVNKNAVLRRSRLSQKSENSDRKSEPPRVTEKTKIQKPISSHDSAIGSDVISVLSLTLEEEILSAEIKNLEFQPHCERLQDQEQDRETTLENNSRQICPISRGMSIVSIDGPQTDMVPSTILDSVQPSSSTSVASSRLPGGISDFVILHTDADIQAVCSYMDHLLNDIGIPDLTVDSFSDIDAGKSQFKSLTTLHDNYRYILTYITDNLENDNYCKFLQEIILTFGLRKANGKEDRVVPVFTKEKRCGIPEISIINGFQYFSYNSGTDFMKTKYIDKVKKLVRIGRTKFP